MRKNIGEVPGRGRVRIPKLEMDGRRVSGNNAATFLFQLLHRNNFAQRAADLDRSYDAFGFNLNGSSSPYDELFLPAAGTRPAGLIRHWAYRPIDRTQSGGRHYFFLSAPNGNKAGGFKEVMHFAHRLKPQQRYGIDTNFESLDATHGKDFTRLQMFETGPSVSMFGQQMQRSLEATRDAQPEYELVLGKIMQQCVKFLAE